MIGILYLPAPVTVPVPCTIDMADLPTPAIVYKFVYLTEKQIGSLLVAYLKGNISGLNLMEQFIGLLNIIAHGFFTVHMFTCVDRFHGHVEMKVQRGGDNYRINFLVIRN